MSNSRFSRRATGFPGFAPLAALVLTLAVGACSGDSPVALADDPGDTPWSMTSDVGAATLVVGGTQQLHPITRLVDGTVVTNASPATFTTSDPLKVSVSAAGMVTALDVTTSPVYVEVRVPAGRLTLIDTVLVAVTAVKYPIKTFTLHTGVTELSANGSIFLPLEATDSSDNDISYQLAVKVTSTNPSIFEMAYGTIRGYAVGKAKLAASTTAYGVAYTDTVELKVINQLSAYLFAYNKATQGMDFNPVQLVMGVGGTVNILNYSGSTTNFEASPAAGVVGSPTASGGNGSLGSITFNTAGTYTITNKVSGGKATIVVLPNT